MVGNAFTSIFEQNLLQMTQMSQEQLKEACLALDWSYEATEGAQTVILPKRTPVLNRPCISSEQQLFKLTEFVSFLEN